MKRTYTFLVPLLATSSLVILQACNPGPSQIKATEIKSIIDVNGGNDIVETVFLEYTNKGLLQEVQRRTEDGRFTWDYSYSNDEISEIDYRGPNDDRVNAEFDVSDGLMTGGKRDGDDYDSKFEVTYFREDARFLKGTKVETDFGSDFGDQRNERISTFSYAGSKISKITTDSIDSFDDEVLSDVRTIIEFKYDADTGLLDRLDTETLTEFDESIVTYRFDYDEDDRIVEVELDENNGFVYDVRYNDDGSVERVDISGPGNDQTIEYTYASGNIKDSFIGLAVPGSFDLQGNTVESAGAEELGFTRGFVGR